MQNSTEEEKLVKDRSQEEIKNVSREETIVRSDGNFEKEKEESPLPESDQVSSACLSEWMG